MLIIYIASCMYMYGYIHMISIYVCAVYKHQTKSLHHYIHFISMTEKLGSLLGSYIHEFWLEILCGIKYLDVLCECVHS